MVPAELRLVYATASGAAGASRVAELLTERLDWTLVAALADRERAVPAVLAAVQTSEPALATAPALDPLRRLAMIATFESVRLEAKLETLLDALAAGGITPVLLKGAGVALQRRGTLRGRPMRDLDVLLAPEEVAPAVAIARTTGWSDSRYAAADPFYEVAAHAAPLEDVGGSQLQLELHGDLFFTDHPFGLTAAHVREGAVPISWKGRALRVPDATSLVLHTALHAAWSHALRGAWWRSWHDVGVLLPANDAGWRRLEAAAATAKAGTSLYWMLRLGRALAGLEVPNTVLARLGHSIPHVLRDALFVHVLGDASVMLQASPSVRLNKFAWRLALQPRASGHGTHTPWEHEALLGFATAPASAMPRLDKLQRHAGRWRSYLNYGRRVLFG